MRSYSGFSPVLWFHFSETIQKAHTSHQSKEKKELSSKKKELEKAKQNLTNPDYVEYIARGKYLVTKEGEQVFKFPSKD